MNEKTNTSGKPLEKLGQIISMVVMLALIVFFIGVMVWGVRGIFSTANSPRPERPEVVKPAVQPMEVVVTSQTVKSVSGKYRYFFDIRNNSEVSFAGDVSVDLVNAEGDSVYDKTFSTNQPISAGLGTSVYIDINTGPTSVHGVNGIQTFSYTAKVNGDVVKSGSGAINASANPN